MSAPPAGAASGGSVTFVLGADHVGVVTVNRPEKRNAMDLSVFAGLHDAARRATAAAADGTCRAVLVTGAGGAFSAGLDLALFGEQIAGAGAFDDDRIAWLQQAFTGFEDLPVPTVAALNGTAIGAGCQLALACHLRVAAPDVRIGFREARWGLLPDLGGTYRLPRLVGLSRAIDLAVSARDLDAATALAWGAVDAVLHGDDFDGQAHAYAVRLARGPTVATGAVPGLMRRGLGTTRDVALAAERGAQLACLGSADFGEAVAAAAEGREPRFAGR
ncbi:MAG: enoyl-CoA hydratase/isomerase family protein [Egibacteraceae bacterium]